MDERAPPPAWEIRIDAIAYTYPGATRPALSDLSLHVEAGEHLAIVGPNGAGKSTLLLHLNGLLTPDAGRVSVGGLPVVPDNLAEIRRRIGLVFQDPDDQLFMPSLLEDVAFGSLCFGASRFEAEQIARRALESVGLANVDPQRAAHHLSGGEKRRAALATVLGMEPGVLAFDEPSAALDGRGRRQIAELLRRQRQTLLIVTHDVEFAAAICQRIVVLDEGRRVADADAEQILRDTGLLLRHGLELASWLYESAE